MEKLSSHVHSQPLALDVVFSTMSKIKNQLSVVRNQSIKDIFYDIYVCNNDIKLITLIVSIKNKRCWKIFHTIAGTGNRAMATLGANGSSPGWKPGSCGGGGPLFIPPDR